VRCHEFDVVVVGAGPAGACAAWAACKSGVSVLLIDRRRQPGNPVQCAEYVPRAVKKYVPLVEGAVVQKIDRLLTFINDEPAAALAGPGYMLNRLVFDASLVQTARLAGAEFRPETAAWSRTDQGIVVHTDQGHMEIKCRVVVGADGPRSTVGRWMNSRNREFMVALQYKMPLVRGQTSTDVYFRPEYEGAYAWVFPKGDSANVGVGISAPYSKKLPVLLQEFISRLTAREILLPAEPEERTAGLIPVGGPLAVTQRENMLLAGDAAGHTHPVSGGGIMNAIVAGNIAGETAARAVRQKDLTWLERYPAQWQAVIGGYLERGLEQRRDMERNWTCHKKEFEDLIRRTWMGVPTEPVPALQADRR